MPPRDGIKKLPARVIARGGVGPLLAWPTEFRDLEVMGEDGLGRFQGQHVSLADQDRPCPSAVSPG